MKIEIIKCLEDNFSYLLIDEITRSAVVIDPSEAEPVINKIESLKIKLINLIFFMPLFQNTISSFALLYLFMT